MFRFECLFTVIQWRPSSECKLSDRHELLRDVTYQETQALKTLFDVPACVKQ